MAKVRPEFHLHQVSFDGSSNLLGVYRLGAVPTQTKLARRNFLAIGLSATSLSAVWREAHAADANRTTQRNLLRGATIHAHSDCVRALAITPDGKTLASGAMDGTIKIWSLPNGELKRTLTDHTNAVHTLALNQTGTVLVSGAADSSILLWKMPEARRSDKLGSVKSAVNVVAIAPDGESLVSVSADGTLGHWTLPDGELVQTYRSLKDAIDLLGSWGVPIALRQLLLRSSRTITAFAISSGAEYLGVGTAGGQVRVWRLPSGKEEQSVKAHRSRIYALNVTPDGKLAATASMDRSVKVIDVRNGKVLHDLRDFPSWTITVCLDASGQILATGHSDGTIMLWDMASGDLLGYCFDSGASQSDGMSYDVRDSTTNHVLTYTLPCGSPIPPNATCVCNCVPGRYRPPTVRLEPPRVRIAPPTLRRRPPKMTSSRCSCVPVCTCVPVFQ